MPDTWVTDMRHYAGILDERRDVPGPFMNLALFVGSIVAWMTSRVVDGWERTNVHCRRTPGRRRCAAVIEATFDPSTQEIVWRCPRCGDQGYIRGWQGCHWDRSRRRGRPLRD